MNKNQTTINTCFGILLKSLIPYISLELHNTYRKKWWDLGVLAKLNDEQKKYLPTFDTDDKLLASLDIKLALLIFIMNWRDVFAKKLSIDHKNWANELTLVRNKIAHIGTEDYNNDDTFRALDTMSRLCEQIDSIAVEEIRKIQRSFRYGSEDGSTSTSEQSGQEPSTSGHHPLSPAKSGILQETPGNSLLAWRKLITPHPDVAYGRYTQAEFAADLNLVAGGKAASEYQDPVEFFSRTFLTEGIKGLLTAALKRVNNQGGEPVLQLKTAFGGGKTHSMLALFHLLRGRINLDKIPSVRSVLDDCGLKTPPQTNIAVVVGTALDPTKIKRPPNMPGITISTLWGEIASQLSISANKPNLYDLVKDADKKGVAPGSDTLRDLFDTCGPCLILIDELVAYGKRIHGSSGLPAGTFDNFITFIQALTEAAKASKNSLVVASLPESQYEIGGPAGQEVLATFEHYFGRLEAVWKPVAVSEGFEVVRRRLFLDSPNTTQIDLVCQSFSRMYDQENHSFPLYAGTNQYFNRLKASYPIHPEVFDRLYEDWASLDSFQRTRGVLRFMAGVIHELWMQNDGNLLIMPGSMPLYSSIVRDELTRHLSDGWNSVVDKDIDGTKSISYGLDESDPRFGVTSACRRLARTIFLGSATLDSANRANGIEEKNIYFGVVQPGETLAIFSDGLSALQNSLNHLYSNQNGSRLWFDTKHTLRKDMEERSVSIKEFELQNEIHARINKIRTKSNYKNVHIFPKATNDVNDEQEMRLVILSLANPHKNSEGTNSKAYVDALNILHNRGEALRNNRNMLIFLASDETENGDLQKSVRQHLAWKSILEDRDVLNLDRRQETEVNENIKNTDKTIDLQINNTFKWLLIPTKTANNDNNGINLTISNLSLNSDKTIIDESIRHLLNFESLIDKLAPGPLLLEMDSFLWNGKDNISIKKLWEYLCSYCYLPRLQNYKVLENAITEGLKSDEYFAYSAGIIDNNYLELAIKPSPIRIDKTGFLVKLAVAKELLPASLTDEVISPADRPVTPGDDQSTTNTTRPSASVSQTPIAAHIPKSFFLATDYDKNRLINHIRDLVTNVIEILDRNDNQVKIKICLEVSAKSSIGFDENTVRSVSENCTTLNVSTFNFGDDDDEH